MTRAAEADDEVLVIGETETSEAKLIPVTGPKMAGMIDFGLLIDVVIFQHSAIISTRPVHTSINDGECFIDLG